MIPPLARALLGEGIRDFLLHEICRFMLLYLRLNQQMISEGPLWCSSFRTGGLKRGAWLAGLGAGSPKRGGHGARLSGGSFRKISAEAFRQDFRDDDGSEDKHEADDDPRDERFGSQCDAESHPEDSFEGKKQRS